MLKQKGIVIRIFFLCFILDILMNIKHKPKNQSIKFEELKYGGDYAITINPLHGIALNQKESAYLREQIKQLMDVFKHNSVTLYPEVSPMGKIHFHGYFHLESLTGWLKDVLRLQVYGTFVLKHLFQQEAEQGNKWELYVKKQSALWADLLDKTLIPYPIKIDPQNPFPWT